MRPVLNPAAGSRTIGIVVRELRRGVGKIAAAVGLMILGTGVGVASPLLFKLVVDKAIPARDLRLAALALTGLTLLPILSTVLASVQGLLRADLGERVSGALREEMFDHLARVRIGEWEGVKPGEIAQSMFEGAGQLGRVYISSQLLNVVSNVILLAGTVATMLALNVRLVLLTLIAFPPSVLFTHRLKKSAKALAYQFHDAAREGSGFVEQFVSGIRTVRAFNGAERETRNWRQWNHRYSQTRAKADLFNSLVRSMPTDVVNNVAHGLVFGYGAYEVIGGSLTVGSLVAFVAFIPRVYGAMRVLLDSQIDTAAARATAEHMDVLFRLDQEKRGGRTPAATDPRGAAIEFRDVSFDYGRGDFNVEDLSFRVKPGEFIGIVGTSGGGKTTIFDLLLGFYTPQSGGITVDGLDLRDWSLESLREAIGFVPQDVFLWNATLRENICYPKENVPAEAVESAAAMGGLREFIETLPDGYETRVGAHGVGFSGGERQRVAISRAVLRQARILLMDEATSALDALTEMKIRDSIERAREGRTTIVIAHRLATVIQADRILVLAEGRIREAGTPRQLLENGGLFHDLYQAQKLDLHLTAEVAG